MLRYKADIRTLFTVLLYFTIAIAPWFRWSVMGGLEMAAWFITNCILSFSCAVIIHNTIHVPIFKSRHLNRIFQVILSFTYGHSVSAYVPGHNFSHHKYTQTDYDSIRTTKARFKINLFNQLFFFYIMSGDIVKGEIRFVKKMFTERPAWFAQWAVEMLLVVSVNVILAILNWKLFLLYWAIPHQYAAWGIVSTNYFQHDGCDDGHPYNHSRNFVGRSLNFFLFNNGYHGAHHMKPNLHWSLLPEYHATHLHPYIHPSLERKSLIAYLWETHIYPGKRVNYLGEPIVLPPPTEDIDWVNPVRVEDHLSDMGTA